MEVHHLAVVLVDLMLGATSGLDFLERVKRERPEVEVIVITGHASIESAVGCIRRGAFDYLAKPFQPSEVLLTLRKAREREQLRRSNQLLERDVQRALGDRDRVGVWDLGARR